MLPGLVFCSKGPGFSDLGQRKAKEAADI